MKKTALKFAPYLKTVIWGGDKICKYKGIPQPEPNIGESWEISAVPGHESVVADGIYQGRTLTDLISEFGPQLLGKRVYERYNGEFPLLIKLIDAADNLSVQVHPDDTLARKRHNSLGKTEMWYIVQRDDDAKIYAGLREQLSPESYEQRVADDSIMDAVACHDSNPGDIFFIPAGRIHAIGKGNLLIEIQQSSDVTYRIYDYRRKDKEGKERELHTELAKDAIDYTVYPDYKTTDSEPDKEMAEIVKCDYFTTYRIRLHGDTEFHPDPTSFSVAVCVEGEASFRLEDMEHTVKAGESILIPAGIDNIPITGNATLLLAQA